MFSNYHSILQLLKFKHLFQPPFFKLRAAGLFKMTSKEYDGLRFYGVEEQPIPTHSFLAKKKRKEKKMRTENNPLVSLSKKVDLFQSEDNFLDFVLFFGWRDSGVSLKVRIFRLIEQTISILTSATDPQNDLIFWGENPFCQVKLTSRCTLTLCSQKGLFDSFADTIPSFQGYQNTTGQACRSDGWNEKNPSKKKIQFWIFWISLTR